MKNFLKLPGIIAIVAVIGFSMAACSNGTTGVNNSSSGKPDTALNGTWVYVYNNYTYGYKLNNGNYEWGGIENATFYPREKGTYTTSANNVTVTITHFYGDTITDGTDTWNVTEKWYSKDDLKQIGISDSVLDGWFTPWTLTYSISGNEVTFTLLDGSSRTCTKQ